MDRCGARAIRVIDGDTLKVRLATGRLATLRLIGIDTPETPKPGTNFHSARRRRAGSLPGVTIEPGQAPPQQTFYDAVGGEPTFRRIVARFYELVATDEILRPLYPEEDLGPAEERLRLFLMQYWGGPTTYGELRGHPRLGMRHMPFRIGPSARDAWLRAMRIAVDEAGLAEAHRAQLWEYLEMVAWNMTTHAR